MTTIFKNARLDGWAPLKEDRQVDVRFSTDSDPIAIQMPLAEAMELHTALTVLIYEAADPAYPARQQEREREIERIRALKLGGD